MQSAVKSFYEIELPNDKAATYKVVTLIIAFINTAAFAYLYVGETDRTQLILSVIGVVVSAVALLLFLLKKKYNALQAFRIEIAFIILAVIWMMIVNVWLGLPLFLFAALGFYTNKKTILRFSDKGLLYPSFPPKLIGWNAIDFVILKDGILTIEFKDNRVLQFTLSVDETAKLQEKGFNDFCEGSTADTQRQ